MSGIGGVKVIYFECEMDLVVAEIVGTVHIPEPGELKKMRRDAVSQIYKLKTSVVGIFCTGDGKAECLFVEGEGFLKIVDIKVVVGKCKFS